MNGLSRSDRFVGTFVKPLELSDIAFAFIAFGAAALLYFSLQGELPYHDAQRFTNQVASKNFVWDIAHILLQPVAMLLHKWTSLGPVETLKLLSSLSAAAAVGIFHLLLLRLDIPRWQAIVATIILACCCSVLTLAPSAHPKLVAFPFINGAFLCLVLAERRGFEKISVTLLVAGGVLLGIAAGFLVSALATAPFLAVAVLLAARRDGARWAPSFAYAAVVSTAAGLTFLCIACLGYMALTGQPLTTAGLIGSIASKAELRPASIPPIVYLARIAFGSVNNLVAVPGLGATAQAFMRGQIHSLGEYKGLLPILGIWLLAGILIAAIYGRVVYALRQRPPIYVAVAFLIGAQAWTIWYGLNDPEHWFMLTAPTILLFLLTFPQRVVLVALPAWAAVACAANFALLAVPVASYPLEVNQTKLASMLGPKDVLVLFGHYPGRPYAGFFSLVGVRKIPVDTLLEEPGAVPEEVLKGVDLDLQQTLSGGGRVIVADILDAQDWEAPWMSLVGRGIGKLHIEQAVLHMREAKRLDDLGGIKLWELHSTSAARK
jgi:hypothetical protein